jgi:hypothetical protein
MTRGMKGIFASHRTPHKKKPQNISSKAMPPKKKASAPAERRPITTEPAANGNKGKKLKEALLLVCIFLLLNCSFRFANHK